MTLNEVDLDDDELEEEPIIHEVHQAAAPQVITRARVVQVAKPVAPQLPTRSPFRNRMSTQSDASMEPSQDASAGPSPHVPKQSPESTPSLVRGDSTSSVSSVEGAKLEQIGQKLELTSSKDSAPAQRQDDNKENEFHSLPESPIKSIPGGFN